METLRNPARHATGSSRVCLCFLGAACLGSAQASAQVVDWGNVNGGGFNIGTNWIGGVVPGAGNRARFARTRSVTSPAIYTVSFSTNPTNQDIVVNDQVTFDLNANAYLLNVGGAVIQIDSGPGGLGRLTITDGVVATTATDSSAYIGLGSGSGLLFISTGGQLLGPRMFVGYASDGTLIVQSGGDLVGRNLTIGFNTGVTGAATISGAGSAAVMEEVFVGQDGKGSLNINSGGQVESTQGVLGHFLSGIGTVNVAGTNSRWTISDASFIDNMIVGSQGRGTLNITGGGLVEGGLGSTLVGNAASGVGTINVAGPNSRWTSSGEVIVGNGGQGTLNITGGGLVQSSVGIVGYGTGGTSTGTVTVEGAGSQWINSSDLSVGYFNNSAATLGITAGGEVRSPNGFIARRSGLGSVNVSGAGSKWTMTGDLSVAGDIGAGIPGGTATLEIGPGGTVSAHGMYIFPKGIIRLQGGTLDATRIEFADGPGGQFLWTSGILHAAFVAMNVLNQGGTLAPGHSAGFTSINGTYTQHAPAVMEIEIGGVLTSEYDRIFVNATSLGGTLDLRLINGFVPGPAQTFVILSASSITGSFANVASGQRLAVSGGGTGSFIVHYGPGSPFDPTQIVLSGFGACPADFNGDGFVTADDYDAFVVQFLAGNSAADFNHDGFVTGDDFDFFVDAFKAGC